MLIHYHIYLGGHFDQLIITQYLRQKILIIAFVKSFSPIGSLYPIIYEYLYVLGILAVELMLYSLLRLLLLEMFNMRTNFTTPIVVSQICSHLWFEKMIVLRLRSSLRYKRFQLSQGQISTLQNVVLRLSVYVPRKLYNNNLFIKKL